MPTDVIQRETMPVPSWLTLRPNVYNPNHAALRDARAGKDVAFTATAADAPSSG